MKTKLLMKQFHEWELSVWTDLTAEQLEQIPGVALVTRVVKTHFVCMLDPRYDIEDIKCAIEAAAEAQG